MLLQLCHRVRLRFYDRPFQEALTAYESIFSTILESLHAESVPKSNRLRLLFGWRPSLEKFNAWATSGLSRNVSLTTGCWSYLQGMANLVMSANDQFTVIGNSAKELRNLEGWIRQGEEASPAPQCPIRKESANLVVEMALCMIALHEISHHALGHLGVGRLRFASCCQSPGQASCLNSAEAARRSQLYELEADRFAISYLAHMTAQRKPAFANQLFEHPELKPHLLEMAIFSLTLIVIGMGGLDQPVNWYHQRSHPHPLVRLISALTAAQETLGADDSRIKSSFSEAISVLLASTNSDALRLVVASPQKISNTIRIIRSTVLLPRRQYDFATGAWVASTEDRP